MTDAAGAQRCFPACFDDDRCSYPKCKGAQRVSKFWSRATVDPVSKCWLWTGADNGQGYGSVYYEGKTWRAHRLAYTLHYGPIPDGMEIDHLCRNRKCIKPEHLDAVTTRINVVRGVGPTAKNARKTHCKKGHPLTMARARKGKRAGRECRICGAEWVQARRDALRAAGLPARKPRSAEANARRRARRQAAQGVGAL